MPVMIFTSSMKKKIFVIVQLQLRGKNPQNEAGLFPVPEYMQISCKIAIDNENII